MKKQEYILIFWTSGCLEEARAISRALVQDHLVAKASITPWTESISMLDGQIETTQESQVSFVTKKEHFEAIRNFISKKAKYEIPELLVVPALEGNIDYLQWVDENVDFNRSIMS